MNVYDLSRNFWNYSFDNPEKIKPNHCAMFFFAIEHCNRLGWKEKFGFPTAMVMDAIGIKSYNTYINTLNDLVEMGFINMIEKSKNQYSSNIIALSIFNSTFDKPLDKAIIKHTTNQSESTIQSTGESIDSIDKQINKSTKQQVNIPELSEFLEYAKSVYENDLGLKFSDYKFSVESKYQSWIDSNWKDGNNKPIKIWKTKLKNTIPHLKAIYNGQSNNQKSGTNSGSLSGRAKVLTERNTSEFT